LDAADGSRDLVFVSYSHADAEWVQRLEVLLKPVVRARRLQVWADSHIRAGNDWYRDLTAAIERTRVGLLLVSGDFLASDFIMDEELPALIARGVPLAPVLVGDCLWNQVHELARVQWLHDPGREGALQLVADRPGERDRRLTAVCERLIALVPEDAGAHPTGPPVVVPALPVEAVATGPGLGPLDGVPGLPPGYLARDELSALIDAVVATETGAVGLTGNVAAVGLHGQGGIGKSVLACALARDEGVRARFPDGVYWVSVGEKADVLAVQLELLARLGAADRAPRSPDEARDQLAEVLRERGALLVVDDVWSEAAAQALRVTGPRGRVLYTSRDPQVLAAAGARLHRVDVLSAAAARALAGGVLDVPPGSLPAAADQAFEAVGRVALAIALLAAAVRGGRSWQRVAEELVHDAEIFGDHPYANTFKAMQVGVAALRDDVAPALLSLAVFPPDTQIPVAAIARYWAHTRGRSAEDVRRDLRDLADANVLSLDEGTHGSAVVGFHDLQHDYLLLHAPKLAELHVELLAAYRALLPSQGRDGWWQLPASEPYILDHLVEHLRGAGEHDTIATTVTDPAYLVRRITLSGPRAAEADLTQAAAVLPTHEGIDWWRDWLGRHAHLLARAEGVADDAGSTAGVAPTMLAWLAAERAPTAGVDVDRLRPLLLDPYLTVRWGLTPPANALRRVLDGHPRGVCAVAWSPRGTHLATAGYGDHEVRLWDPDTGHHRTTLTGHTGRVSAVAWSPDGTSPDGTRLASASDDGEVRLWDPDTGHHRTTLTGHTGRVSAVTWSPDGTWLATAGYGDREVRLWDPDTGHRRTIRTGHTDGVCAVAWSPKGTNLATAGYGDREVRLWDPDTGHHLDTLTGHTDGVSTVAWSPDGSRLASAGHDRAVRLWDPDTGHHCITRTDHTSWVRAVAWSPGGSRLAIAGDNQEVRLWNLTTGHHQPILTGHTGGVSAVAWSPDGTRLATAGHDGEVRLWDPAAGDHRTSPTGRVRAVAWSPDGTRLATAGDDQEVRLWNPTTGHHRATLTGHTAGVSAVAWSQDGTWLASAGDDQEVRLWNPTTGHHRTLIHAGHSSWVRAVAWSPGGTRLATAGHDGEVRLWDPTTGHYWTLLTGHTDRVSAVAWSSRGTHLATAGYEDREVRLWDPDNGHHLDTLTGHTGGVSTVAWSPEGSRLASAGDDGEVRLWDPDTGHHRIILAGCRSWVRAMAWSPDGTRLASAGEGGDIRLWDLSRTDHQTYLQVDPLACLQWAGSGIAVGGAKGVIVLDVAHL